MAVKDIIQERLNTIALKLRGNPLAWGLWYVGHHFRSPSPGFHRKIINESLRCQFLAIAAPRGSAKSTIVTFLRPLYAICYKLEHFIVLLSNTEEKATGSLATIKEEIKHNQGLKADFNITIIKDNESDSVFLHPDGHKTRVLCKGHKQMGSIRGEKFGAWRPTLIILDDIEDDDMVKSPDRRRDLKDVFDNAITPALDSEVGKINVIGTILHDDSLMIKLVDKEFYPDYRKLFYISRSEVAGVKYSLWNEKWTVTQLDQIEKDRPHTFAKEYQNDPSFGDLQGINPNDFRRYYIDGNRYVLLDAEGTISSKGNLTDCRAAIACDLAWEQKRQHDYSVIMPGYLTPNSDLLIGDYICKKGLRPNQIEEYLFVMVEKIEKQTGSRVPIGFEKAKLEKVTKWFLKRAMRQRNRYLIIKDLQWGTDKVERILSKLEPRYSQHTVFHKQGMGDLELQLKRVRSAAHDDLADAAQGLVQLLTYPKSTKKKQAPVEDEGFDWLRKLTIDAKKPFRPSYKFGSKNKHNLIPAKISWR